MNYDDLEEYLDTSWINDLDLEKKVGRSVTRKRYMK